VLNGKVLPSCYSDSLRYAIRFNGHLWRAPEWAAARLNLLFTGDEANQPLAVY
jgi:hypothetical protein